MASWTALPIFDPGKECRGRGGRFWWRSLERLATAGEVNGLGTVGQKTEMADAHEAGRQHVEQKPADELAGVERHGFLLAGIFAIPVGERDAPFFNRENSVIGNSGAVSIAAQIGEDDFRRGKRPLGVDHPFLLSDARKELPERARFCQRRDAAVKDEFAAGVGGSEEVEKFGTEDDAQGADMKQEVGAGRDPSRPVETERAAGNQAVYMVMAAESLIPGVEYPEESDPAVQVGAAEIGQGFRDGLEENGNERLGVHQEKGIQFMGNREDQMEVLRRKEFLLSALKPAVGG